MKKLILAASIAFAVEFAAPQQASAQETYSIVISVPANVTKIDIGRQLANQAVCTRFSLAASCTQAQACTASFSATGQPATGGACTAQEAQTANVRIYPNTLAGREAFILQEMVRANMDIYARQKAKLDFAALQSFCKTATQPQIDGVCTASGLPAGCGVCDSWR